MVVQTSFNVDPYKVLIFSRVIHTNMICIQILVTVSGSLKIIRFLESCSVLCKINLPKILSKREGNHDLSVATDSLEESGTYADVTTVKKRQFRRMFN